MDVILLERVAKLGQIGEVVRVKDGYARNYLLPKGKALRATAESKTRFENMKSQIEARNLERRTEAGKVAEKLDGKSFIIIRQAGETGMLYGSVTSKDIADAISADGFILTRQQVVLNTPIKALGISEIAVDLHPDVHIKVKVNVARSTEEADRQARGEDITASAREAQARENAELSAQISSAQAELDAEG